MLGALAVTALAFRVVLKRSRPWFAERFALPTKQDIDPRLIGGGVLFGIGWGLSGLCPGPALAALVTAQAGVFVFVGSDDRRLRALQRARPRVRLAAAGHGMTNAPP